MTSCESFLSKAILAPSALATLSPVSMALYSASVLVIRNWIWTPYFKVSPSGVVMTTPTPPLFCVDDSSVWIVQRLGSSWLSLCSGMVNFAMKSTSAWAFMAILGRYSMPN